MHKIKRWHFNNGKDKISERWSEYIEDLFDDERGQKPVIRKNVEGPRILKAEVTAAIAYMKRNKAAGPDGIVVEMIEALEGFRIDTMTEIINEIYDSGTIPEDLSKSIFIALPKKPNATECELHRTISHKPHEPCHQNDFEDNHVESKGAY